MENEIKVGEYARTNKGRIFIYANEVDEDGYLKDNILIKVPSKYYKDAYTWEREWLHNEKIEKHSKNLLKLIKEKDVIEYWRNENLYKDEVWQVVLEDNAILNNEGDLITFDSIERIFTKEMMESISYKVKE